MLRDLSPETLRETLDGGGDMATLVGRLVPLLQVRTARVLRRKHAGLPPRGIRHEVEDQVQDVLVVLFRDGGRVLRQWQPGRGMSLANYVGLVAERHVISTLRSGRKTWREDIVPADELDGPSSSPGRSAEHRATDRDLLGRLLARMQAELSVYGWQMFQLLFVEEKSVAEVSRDTGSSADAIYAWRSRLRKRARELWTTLTTDSAASERIPRAEARGDPVGRLSRRSIRRGER